MYATAKYKTLKPERRIPKQECPIQVIIRFPDRPIIFWLDGKEIGRLR